MCSAGPLYLNQCSDSSNPVKIAYSRGIDTDPLDCRPAYPSWDLIAVYAAIAGTEASLMYEEPGTISIDELG